MNTKSYDRVLGDYKLGRLDELLAVYADLSALSEDKKAMKSANSLFIALVRRMDVRAAKPEDKV